MMTWEPDRPQRSTGSLAITRKIIRSIPRVNPVKSARTVVNHIIPPPRFGWLRFKSVIARLIPSIYPVAQGSKSLLAKVANFCINVLWCVTSAMLSSAKSSSDLWRKQ